MTTFNAGKLAPKSNSRNLGIVIKIMYLVTFFTINIANCYSNNCQCISDNMVLLLILQLSIPACTYLFRVVHEWWIDKWFNIFNSINDTLWYKFNWGWEIVLQKTNTGAPLPFLWSTQSPLLQKYFGSEY